MPKNEEKLAKSKSKSKSETALTSKKDYVEDLSRLLTRQTITQAIEDKYASHAFVLSLVGAGLFVAASVVAPNLPKLIKPYYKDDEYEAEKRFNIPRLRQTLNRLQKQKLVTVSEKNGQQIVEITDQGRRHVIKASLDKLSVTKPKLWDGEWWLVSYDLPVILKDQGEAIRDYLNAWGFYPLHESLYLHAYPCAKQIEFLREYLGVGDYLRLFKVSAIENPQPFRAFFGL